MTPSTSLASRGPMIGIALAVAAVFMFSISDVVGKVLFEGNPVSVIVALRYAISLAMIFAISFPTVGARLWQTKRTGLVLARGMSLAVCSIAMGYAFRFMPVGETVAIVHIAPFVVVLLAGPLLGENVRPIHWIGASLGFAGVLLIVRPGVGLAPIGVMFAMITAGFSVFYHLFSRVLARTENAIAMLFFTNVVGAVVFILPALFEWQAFAPTTQTVMFIVLLGMSATSGHYFFTLAYRFAPASLLAPMQYVHLVFATIMGWGVFGHLPDVISMLGMMLIICGGVAVALHTQFKRNSPAE